MNAEDFWISLATQKMPKELLGQRRVTLRMKASRGYFLSAISLSLFIFTFGAFMFGRLMGYF